MITYYLISLTDSNIGEEFRNRKGIFSINVQVVCTASLVFQNVVARWPGSTHDATIFNHSDFKGIFLLFGFIFKSYKFIL